ncbi:MAG: MerR family transcriptional regulator [Alphaproteobacteria bacterium]|nr:MerR family transcriptional regulator [Alphaproteobacteria bacterium]
MQMLTIGEVSKQSGVTVRTLRYYESKGLISPVRSESRQRLYRYKDVLRLQQIQLLKRTGLTLGQITEMIGSNEWDAHTVLGIQKDLLEKQRAQINKALTLIDDAMKALEDDTSADLSTLCHIIKIGENAMSEEKWQKVWDKFYTPEEQERWKAAKGAIPANIVEEHQRKWPSLIARTEALVATNTSPASDEAQAVLKEWQEMSRPLMETDPSLAKSATKLYDNMDSWPEGAPEAPFSKEVWHFIQAAGQATNKHAV